jgi:hypothetical protein
MPDIKIEDNNDEGNHQQQMMNNNAFKPTIFDYKIHYGMKSYF